ncbi:MAG: SprT family zinc-dependent metalloprotease [Lachnospiraceae bacterium]|nr:SprT family zinc-dependent metalloprotease [Lachnospiraceae bacterium]
MIKQMKLGFTYQGEAREIWIDVLYSDRKTLGLEVARDGQVKLRAPRRTSDSTIQTFAQEKKAWIIEKYLMMEGRREAASERGVPDYVEHPELEKKYRQLAKVRIQERAAYFAARMGVSYGRISIRAAKTRWGSCSYGGNLNFHWKLILMPPEILDYVVVHELAHRKEMNHSKAFWAEVERILPDYQERRKWLKLYGQTV